MLQEFFRPAMHQKLYESVDSLRADLDLWLHHYNRERPHLGYRNQGRRPRDHGLNLNGYALRDRARSGVGLKLGGWLLLAVGATVVTASDAKADVARYEMLPFVSATMSDHEFLSGADGTPTLLAGQLRLPRKGEDRLPTMLIIHGSSGVGETDGIVDHAAKQLNTLGIATFVIDSFSPRGLTSTITDQSRLGRLQMIYDAYRALELLAKHPRVDPERIGVIGISRGAEASIFAAAGNTSIGPRLRTGPSCSSMARRMTGRRLMRARHTSRSFSTREPMPD